MVRLKSRPGWGTAVSRRRLDAEVRQLLETERLHPIRIANGFMIANTR